MLFYTCNGFTDLSGNSQRQSFCMKGKSEFWSKHHFSPRAERGWRSDQSPSLTDPDPAPEFYSNDDNLHSK